MAFGRNIDPHFKHMHSDFKKFPPAFIERFQKIIPQGLQHQALEAYRSDRPTTFRINTLKSSSAQLVLDDLKRAGLEIQEIKAVQGAYQILKGSFKKLESSQSFEKGHIYLQSLSSQLPPIILQPKSGERVLDMTASPGGKTTQMAALMKNQGTLTALEPENIRFARLKHNCDKQGAAMVECLQTRGETFTAEPFDKILLDAPCSSEGTFNVHQQGGFRHWSTDFISKISKLQSKLLHNAAGLLKPGGHLLYSTCALSPEENEEIIQSALEAHSDLQVVPITFSAGTVLPNFSSWNGKKFTFQGAIRVVPSKMWEGFFLSLLKKKI